MAYDYRKAIMEDIKNVLGDYPRQQNESIEEYKERLYEELWIDDSVTGNGSGSYTFNREVANEYLIGNFSLLHDALCEFDYSDIAFLEKGSEWCDVTIRCYLLGECIEEVVDEIDFDEEEIDE